MWSCRENTHGSIWFMVGNQSLSIVAIVIGIEAK